MTSVRSAFSEIAWQWQYVKTCFCWEMCTLVPLVRSNCSALETICSSRDAASHSCQFNAFDNAGLCKRKDIQPVKSDLTQGKAVHTSATQLQYKKFFFCSSCVALVQTAKGWKFCTRALHKTYRKLVL